LPKKPQSIDTSAQKEETSTKRGQNGRKTRPKLKETHANHAKKKKGKYLLSHCKWKGEKEAPDGNDHRTY